MKRRIPSTTALLCFEAAARTENFAQAANNLNMTQSALSRQIQTLEAGIKQQLFKRAKQRVKLTAAGHALVAELSPQLENLEAMFLKIRSHDKLEGALNIGTYPTFGSRWLMPKIIELAQQEASFTLNTITYLSNGEIDPSLVDIAIVQGVCPWPGYRADYFLPETLVVIASPEILEAVVLDPLELLNQRILQHITRPDSWRIWLESQNCPLPNSIIGPMFHQFEMLIDAVKGGHGIAIVPKLLVEKELKEGKLTKAHSHEITPEGAYYLLTPTVKVGTQKIERIRKWLLKSVNI
ncbi:MAG: LysR family glycine cleavage system transcriptional activator [Paracoccaceae bacterium]|jgi:LysR family glycine cleavage system transcriptional activator